MRKLRLNWDTGNERLVKNHVTAALQDQNVDEQFPTRLCRDNAQFAQVEYRTVGRRKETTELGGQLFAAASLESRSSVGRTVNKHTRMHSVRLRSTTYYYYQSTKYSTLPSFAVSGNGVSISTLTHTSTSELANRKRADPLALLTMSVSSSTGR